MPWWTWPTRLSRRREPGFCSAPRLREDMTAYLSTHPNRDNPDAPVFPGTTQHRTPGVSGSHRVLDWSKPWEPGTFYKRQFKPALAAAGLLPARTRMHDLRHTAASLMLIRRVASDATMRATRRAA